MGITQNRPRILFISTRETTYARNEVIIRALERFSELEILGSAHRPKSLGWQSILSAVQAIPRIILGDYDLIFIGFYGHLLMIPLGILARQKIIFDAFLSTYDTLIEDRGVGSKNSLLAWLARLLDRTSCNLAEHILLDTDRHIDYFVKNYSIPREKFSAIPVGCNEDIFHPRLSETPSNETRVLYYCSYLPLHGVEIVVRAAERLRDEPIQFILVGSGPTFELISNMVEELNLSNIHLLTEMSSEAIAEEINKSDICLGGHFGTSEKAGRVVPGKIYQILAMERPVIACATPANLQLLEHGKSAFICPPGDDEALAQAVKTLQYEARLRESLAKGGRQLYLEKCSEDVITELLFSIIHKMV